MEFEFDKEIDSLLRQTAQGETVATLNPKSKIQNPKSAHLDADELSAFAENALPEKTRLNYISHLADCDRCRKILSNLIEINSAAQSETVHAADAPPLAATAPEVPWYRKFFAVPTLAYAMGALILLFAGFGVFTILQNDSRNTEVSQTYEKQIGGKGAASDSDALTQEMPGNRASANSAMNSAASSNMMANASNPATVAPSATANSNAAITPREVEPNLAEGRKDDKSLIARSQPQKAESSGIAAAPAPPPPPPAKQSDDFALDEQKETQPPSGSGQNQAQNKPQIMPRAPLPATGTHRDEESQDAAKLSLKRNAADTIVVSGKTFNRANNAWIDAAYRGQATTNVSRGTNEYKKLDSGLRGIVENLGGTVVIVWKSKAYRIQ